MVSLNHRIIGIDEATHADDRPATAWQNCEYRSYEFVDPSGKDVTAAVRELKESWRRRRDSATPGLNETEKRELRAATVGWLENEFEKNEESNLDVHFEVEAAAN
jgi:hypothetical protein